MLRFTLPLLFLTYSVRAAETPRLYFVDPQHTAEHAAITEPITVKPGTVDLNLEIATNSVDEQNTLTVIVVDDYRYDTVNYFTDHRVPNVKFVVSRMENGAYVPVNFRAASQGSGRNLQYLEGNVWFQIGGDPEKVSVDEKSLIKQYSEQSIKFEELSEKLKALHQQFDPNQPGQYQIQATYEPSVAGQWQGKLVSNIIEVIIPEPPKK
jgi:hypothetical protein